MRHSETASMKIVTVNVSHWYQESCSNYKHLSIKWEIYPSNTFLYCCIFKIDIINVSYYYHTTFSCDKNWSSKWDFLGIAPLRPHTIACASAFWPLMQVSFMSKRFLPYAFRLLSPCFNTIILWHRAWHYNHSIIVATACDQSFWIILYKSCQTQTSN